MTPQAKGDELVKVFLKWTHGSRFCATRCAVKAVEEIINCVQWGADLDQYDVYNQETKEYWNDVLNYLKSKQ